jgi:hypothetical protein
VNGSEPPYDATFIDNYTFIYLYVV